MIFVVTSRSHAYTHEAVTEALPGTVRRVIYPVLLTRRLHRRGTYIFTDFDRLSFWQVEIAAELAHRLAEAGCRVLNDPARVLPRLALLRRLHREGINSFQAWPAAEADCVDRFPVFLRLASAHRGNLTGLLEDRAALIEAIEAALREGMPIGDLIIVEFRARAFRDDVHRKLSVYRVADALIPVPSVHERAWTAKFGADGVAGEEAYEEDLARIRANPYADLMRRVFEIANIDYGRVDFGIDTGRPEIFEINTNPYIHAVKPTRFAARAEAARFTEAAYMKALAALDTASDGSLIHVVPPKLLRRQPRHLRLIPGYQWMP